MFRKLSSATTKFWHTRAAVAAHSLEIKVSRCRTYQFASCFLLAQVSMRNDLRVWYDTGTLNEFKGTVNWLLPLVVFLPVFRGSLSKSMCSSSVHTFRCVRYVSKCVGSTTRTLQKRVTASVQEWAPELGANFPIHSKIRTHSEMCQVTVTKVDFSIFGSHLMPLIYIFLNAILN